MTASGWFPDPDGGEGLRWWDGQQWTEDRAPSLPSTPPTLQTPGFEAPTEPIRAVPADEIQSPGWWQAADGRWYPPEDHPDFVPAGGVVPSPEKMVPTRAGRPLYRQRWLAAVLAALVVLLVIVVVSTPKKKKNASVAVAPTTTTTQTIASVAPVPTGPSSTTTIPATTLPAPTTTATPPTTAQPVDTAPPTTATPPTTAAASLCGAPPNPMGYNFCDRGTFIFSPDPSTCNYFTCIGSFSNGKGYMVECIDGQYSMSGGRPGACSSHGGKMQTVYSGP